jgi:SOS regulatory protein LexA
MRSKDKTVLNAIEAFICNYTDLNGYSPTMQEIADEVGVSRPTVYRYVVKLCEDGVLSRSGYRSLTSTKGKAPVKRVPVVGEIACGVPMLAEENIEEYMSLPTSLIGNGDFFLLHANGDSMIEIGVNDGDLVLVRQQNSATEGQVVVALTEDGATLKRFYPESENHRIRLHPENRSMEDYYVYDCEIQGVAVKVLKDIE